MIIEPHTEKNINHRRVVLTSVIVYINQSGMVLKLLQMNHCVRSNVAYVVVMDMLKC